MSKKLPSSKDNEAFWLKFSTANAAAKKVMMDSTQFPSHVWAGIPSEYRSKLWSANIDAPVTKFCADNNSDNDTLLKEIEREIDITYANAAHGSITQQQRELIRVVLQIDASMYNLPTVRPNSVRLVESIMGVTQTISATLEAYQWLNHRSKLIWADEHKVFESWSHVVTDFLCGYEALVDNEFIHQDTTPNDIYTFFTCWFLPMLSCHFPVHYGHRLIDIVLFDPLGIKALIPAMIGLWLDVHNNERLEDSVSNERVDAHNKEHVSTKTLIKFFQSTHFANVKFDKDSPSYAFETGFSDVRCDMKVIDEYINKRNVKEIKPQDKSKDPMVQLERVRALLKEVNDRRQSSLNSDSASNLLHKTISVSPSQNQNQNQNQDQESGDVTVLKIKSAINSLEALTLNSLTNTADVQKSLKDLKSLLESHTSVSSVSIIKIPEHPSNTPNFTHRQHVDKGLIKYTELGYYLQFPCAHMEGYLSKARVSSTPEQSSQDSYNGSYVNLKQQLSSRFFVLQGPFLAHFASHLHSSPTKDLCVDMRGRTITVVDNHPLGNYCIEIYTHKNTCLYLLFAPNETERKKWVYALAAVARLPRSTSQ